MGSPVQIPTADTSDTSAGDAPILNKDLLLIKTRDIPHST